MYTKFFEDSSVAFEDVKHHGYYTCNNKNFLYRYNAFIEASKRRVNFDWVFNEDVYRALDWSKPVNSSLASIQRACPTTSRQVYLPNFSI